MPIDGCGQLLTKGATLARQTPPTAGRATTAEALLVCLLCITLAAPAAGQGGTVYIKDDTGLRDALVNPRVRRIVLRQDVTLSAGTFWSGVSRRSPYLLRRNLTITSQPFSILDFAFVGEEQVALAPGTSLNFSSIVLANSRYGAGMQLDFIAPSPGAQLVLWDVVVERAVCYTRLGEVQAVAVQPRFPGYPGEQRARYLDHFCLRDQCIANTLVYEDFTKISSATTDSAAGGYGILFRNTTKFCLSVADECAQASVVDACIQRALDAADTTARTPGQLAAAQAAQATRRRNAIIGAAVGTSVGGTLLLLLLLVALLLVRPRLARRRLQLAKADGGAGLLPAPAAGSGGGMLLSSEASGQLSDAGTGCTAQISKDVAAGSGSAATASSSHGGHKAAVIRAARDQAGERHSPSRMQDSWELAAWKTSSLFELAGQQPAAAAAAGGGGAACEADGSQIAAWPRNLPLSSYDLMLQGTYAASTQLVLSLNRVSLGVLLGAGAFGRVYRGRWRGMDVAVKVVRHSQELASAVANEVDLMMGFQHPHVVSAYYFATYKRSGSSGDSYPQPLQRQLSRDSGTTTGGASPMVDGAVVLDMQESRQGGVQEGGADDMQTWIVQEFCDGGSLGDYSFIHGEKQAGQLPEGHAMLRLLFRLREVADGMAYLHDTMHVVHGDLKAANVLLRVSPTAPYGRSAKVADFGLSRAHAAGQTHRSTRTLGTVSHMAPELLRFGAASKASDVWAFGHMMWELLTGQPVFRGMPFGFIYEQVALLGARPRIPEGTPEGYALLMQSCWHQDPTQRPSFGQVLRCIEILITGQQQLVAEAASSGNHAAAATAMSAASSALRRSSSCDPGSAHILTVPGADAGHTSESNSSGTWDLTRVGSMRHVHSGSGTFDMRRAGSILHSSGDSVGRLATAAAAAGAAASAAPPAAAKPPPALPQVAA